MSVRYTKWASELAYDEMNIRMKSKGANDDECGNNMIRG